MSYDIYGEFLERGHCEVHPWVHCEYPCPVCLSSADAQRRERDEYSAYCDAQANEYYAQLTAEEEYQSWSAKP